MTFISSIYTAFAFLMQGTTTSYHYALNLFSFIFCAENRTFEEFKCRKAWKMTVGLPIVREDRRVASKPLYMFLPQTYIYICREMEQLLISISYFTIVGEFLRFQLRIFTYFCLGVKSVENCSILLHRHI